MFNHLTVTNNGNPELRRQQIYVLLEDAREYARQRPDDYIPSPEAAGSDDYGVPNKLNWKVLTPVTPGMLDAFGLPYRPTLQVCECGFSPGGSLSVVEDLCYALNFGRNLKINSRKAKT